MKKIVVLIAFFVAVQSPVFSQEKLDGIDQITDFHEGLAGVRKGNEWGFVNKQGELVIDFRNDIVWNKEVKSGNGRIAGIRYPAFKNGMCLVQKMEDEIPLYGYINTKGDLIVDYKFLNISTFEDGYATGVYFDKVFRGNNEFKLKIYDFKFHDVLINDSGEIVEFFDRRYNIQMTKKRYDIPTLRAKYLANDVVAVFKEGAGWEIRKVVL